MNDIPVRIMEFSLDIDSVSNNARKLAILLGGSMTLPYLEPYLIRSMKQALESVEDEQLAAEIRQFIGQEAQHFRQHMKMNDLVRSLTPGMASIESIERELEADYQRFTNTSSLKFNLAYAEGFEALTSAVVTVLFENGILDWLATNEKTKEIGEIFRWHFLEELEHKSVTFDVYDHLFGGYFYRCFVGAYAQFHFLRYVYRFMRNIQDNLPENTSKQRTRSGSGNKWFALKAVASVVKTYSPFYDPNKIETSNRITELSEQLSKQAIEIR